MSWFVLRNCSARVVAATGVVRGWCAGGAGGAGGGRQEGICCVLAESVPAAGEVVARVVAAAGETSGIRMFGPPTRAGRSIVIVAGSCAHAGP